MSDILEYREKICAFVSKRAGKTEIVHRLTFYISQGACIGLEMVVIIMIARMSEKRDKVALYSFTL